MSELRKKNPEETKVVEELYSEPQELKEIVAKPKKESAQQAKMREDDKLVDIIFRNNEVTGGALEFECIFYKGEEVKKYILQDGHRYSLPLKVVRHVNNLGEPQYEYKNDEHGRPKVTFKRIKKRFTCEDVSFASSNSYIDHIDGFKPL